jgi:hypothetical protein
MREALLAVTDTPAPPPHRTRGIPRMPEVTGELRIASREDFEKLERQIRALRRGRLAAPVLLVLLAAAAGAAAWRWSDLYALAGREAPALLELVPAALRPAGYYDGEEHEPNDTPAQANALPLPMNGEAPARIQGSIGARISDVAGDVDVYRVDVPAGGRARAALIAEWTGPDGRDGIRGLDVALSLNRDRAGDGPRRSAPLIASADRGGPGRPERLVAAVEPGTYWVSVRERHADGEWPVELPGQRYTLRVRLADPRPGEEVEPNDAPEAAERRALRYPEWRALAERNALVPGVPLRGQTSPEDPDTLAFAVGSAPAPEAHPSSEVAVLAERAPAGLLVVVPGPNLALRAHVWIPDKEDLAPRGPDDRVRFERAGEAGAGEVLLVRVDPTPAPPLFQLRAAAGEGEYAALAIAAAGPPGAAVALFRSLEVEGRLAQALELAAGVARLLPGSPAARALAEAGGDLAARAAPGLPTAARPRFARAAELLGAPLFEATGAGLRYTGAFAPYALPPPPVRPQRPEHRLP